MVNAPRSTRRTRQHIKVMHCPEGWHSTSGAADEPSESLCATLMDNQWRNEHRGFDRAKYDAHHEQHPVVWIVQTRAKGLLGSHRLMYCHPEMPAENRPDPDAKPCLDCRHLPGLAATSYAVDGAVLCGPCGIARYGARAAEYLINKA